MKGAVPMDRDRFEELIILHQAEIYRYIRYLGATADAAEDLVQETFLAAFSSPNGPEMSDVRGWAAWLRGIARNCFRMYFRRLKNSPVKVDTTVLAQAEDTWNFGFLRGGDGFDTMEALRGCLSTLPDKQRSLVDLQYAKKTSRSEMAAMFQMTEDGIKSLLRRVRVALADCVEKRLKVEQA